MGYNSNGIYFCTNFDSHKKKYLFLKKGNRIKILNSDNPAKVINEISAFLIEMKVDKPKAIEYLKASIDIVNDNLNKMVDEVLVNDENWSECK